MSLTKIFIHRELGLNITKYLTITEIMNVLIAIGFKNNVDLYFMNECMKLLTTESKSQEVNVDNEKKNKENQMTLSIDDEEEQSYFAVDDHNNNNNNNVYTRIMDNNDALIDTDDRVLDFVRVQFASDISAINEARREWVSILSNRNINETTNIAIQTEATTPNDVQTNQDRNTNSWNETTVAPSTFDSLPIPNETTQELLYEDIYADDNLTNEEPTKKSFIYECIENSGSIDEEKKNIKNFLMKYEQNRIKKNEEYEKSEWINHFSECWKELHSEHKIIDMSEVVEKFNNAMDDLQEVTNKSEVTVPLFQLYKYKKKYYYAEDFPWADFYFSNFLNGVCVSCNIKLKKDAYCYHSENITLNDANKYLWSYFCKDRKKEWLDEESLYTTNENYSFSNNESEHASSYKHIFNNQSNIQDSEEEEPTEKIEATYEMLYGENTEDTPKNDNNNNNNNNDNDNNNNNNNSLNDQEQADTIYELIYGSNEQTITTTNNNNNNDSNNNDDDDVSNNDEELDNIYHHLYKDNIINNENKLKMDNEDVDMSMNTLEKIVLYFFPFCSGCLGEYEYTYKIKELMMAINKDINLMNKLHYTTDIKIPKELSLFCNTFFIKHRFHSFMNNIDSILREGRHRLWKDFKNQLIHQFDVHFYKFGIYPMLTRSCNALFSLENIFIYGFYIKYKDLFNMNGTLRISHMFVSQKLILSQLKILSLYYQYPHFQSTGNSLHHAVVNALCDVGGTTCTHMSKYYAEIAKALYETMNLETFEKIHPENLFIYLIRRVSDVLCKCIQEVEKDKAAAKRAKKTKKGNKEKKEKKGKI